MVWTSTDRLKMLGAVDTAYLNAIKNNAEWLKTRFQAAHHDAGIHNKKIDNATGVNGSYPCLISICKNTSAGVYLADSIRGLGGHGLTFDAAGAGIGHCKLTIPAGFASAADYCALVSPITSDPERAALSSYTAQVRHTSATSVTVWIHVEDSTAGYNMALADCDFVIAIWGKHTDADSGFPTWTSLPDLLDGGPVPLEWLATLMTNIDELRDTMDNEHDIATGLHRANSVPVASGVALYKRSIYAGDRREWIIEPWSHGVPDGSFSQIQAGGASDVQIAQWGLDAPVSNELTYGTLITPQPFSDGSETMRARLAHPQQYRDATLVAPRYWADGSPGEWSWADQDDNGTGAPDSLAFMRFYEPTKPASTYLGRRLSVFDYAAVANGTQLGLMFLTMLRDQLEEMKRIFESAHSIVDGTHEVTPPGILGAGRVVYSGSSYTLQTWSTGVASVAKLSSTPNGCRLTFSSAFSSYRSFGVLVTADSSNATPTADQWVAPQVIRNTGATTDVIIHSGSTPAAGYYSFNYVLIGAR